jgi:6-phosphogluconolactonase
MVTILSHPKEDCDKEVAKIIRDSIQKILQTKDKVILGIVGGRSVSGIYELLISSTIPWGRVHIFMVDERFVPLTNKDSNFRLAAEIFIEELMQKGSLPAKNVHPFDVKKGLDKYQNEFKMITDKFDLIILSSGEDGHVAALFPNHHSTKDKSEYFLTMDDSPKPPAKRITASLSLLKKSEIVIVLFYGKAKKEAYEKFHDDDLSVNDCPAKFINDVQKGYIATDLE